MITSAQEYLSRLQDIRNENLHKEVLQIPSDELIYAVDLNSRTIDTPVYLSTETDHTAETIFFIVDRYYETYDLSQSTCVIEFINAKNEPGIYLVPIYDLETYAADGKMLIPWVIQGSATKAAGTIKYAWYIINTGKDPADAEPDELIEGADKFTYKPEDAANPLEEITTADVWQELYQELTSVLQQGSLNLY